MDPEAPTCSCTVCCCRSWLQLSLVPKAAVKGWSLGGMLSFCFLYRAQVLFLGYDQSIRKQHLTLDLLNYHSGRSAALPAEAAIHAFPDVASCLAPNHIGGIVEGKVHPLSVLDTQCLDTVNLLAVIYSCVLISSSTSLDTEQVSGHFAMQTIASSWLLQTNAIPRYS